MLLIGKKNDYLVFKGIVAFCHQTLVKARFDPVGDETRVDLGKLLCILRVYASDGDICNVKTLISPEWSTWFDLMNKNCRPSFKDFKKFHTICCFLIEVIEYALKMAHEGEVEKARLCFDAIHVLPFSVVGGKWDGGGYRNVYMKNLEFLPFYSDYLKTKIFLGIHDYPVWARFAHIIERMR